jgi:hypothetical protein
MNARGRSVTKPEMALLTCLFACVLGLSLWHLRTYPSPFFDEGWYVQVPRNLVLYGEYATLSSEGFRHDDTVLSVAPTIYVPVAVAFKLSGFGWLQARLVMVGYLLAAAAALYLLARGMYGRTVGVAALYLFLFRMEDEPWTSTLYLGRMVMGEVPGLLFYLLGSLVWCRAVDSGRNGRAAAAGVLFGLAMVTKLQFAVLIAPTLVITGLVAQLWLRRQAILPAMLSLAISLAFLGCWFACVWWLVGPRDFSQLIQNLRDASQFQVSVVSLVTFKTGMKFLFRSGFLVFGVPALLYATLLCLRRERTCVWSLQLSTFVMVCVAWYLFRSIGWSRYAYPALALTSVFIAKLLVDLGGGLRLAPGRFLTKNWYCQPANALGLAALMVLVFMPLGTFRLVAKDLFASPNDSLQEFAQYVRASVPKTAVIETWEWEITLLDVEHRYHIPPTHLLDTMIGHIYFGGPYLPSKDYDFRQFKSDYLVIGPFARWTNTYPAELLAGRWRRVVQVGEYELLAGSGP